METVKTLETRVIDSGGIARTVSIRRAPDTDKLVLAIDGTPGQWYLQTLALMRDDTICIDYGQNWTATGMHAVADEMRTLYL